MPNARSLGYAAQRVVRDLQDTQDANAELIAVALADLLDGDNDTSRAQRVLLRLTINCTRECFVLSRLDRDDMRGAEDAAMNLARDAKHIFGKPL